MNQLLPAGALTDTPLAIALQPVFQLIPPEVKSPPSPDRKVLMRRLRKFRGAATKLEKKLAAQTPDAIHAPSYARRKELVLLYRQIADAIETGALPPILNQVDDPRQIEILHRSHWLPDLQVDSHAVHILMDRTGKVRKATPYRHPVLEYYQVRDGEYAFDDKGLDALVTLVRFAAQEGIVARTMATALQTQLGEARLMRAMGIADQNRFRLAKSVLEGLRSAVLAAADTRLAKLESLARYHGERYGFVPTPAEWIPALIEASGTRPGMRALDAAAGTGRIADGAATCCQARVTVIEIQRELVSLLRLKNYPVIDQDFLRFVPVTGFDRVFVDPPRLQDAPFFFIRHAYEVLKRNGRVVSIMALAEFERSDPVAMDFYRWFQRAHGRFAPLTVHAERQASGLLIVDKH